MISKLFSAMLLNLDTRSLKEISSWMSWPFGLSKSFIVEYLRRRDAE
jgi:hypothetical protein